MLTAVGNDNWDDDFATSISPSALHLPHLKPHDNFGGLLSADKLKAFASFESANDDSENWDDNFEGDLITIKGLPRSAEGDTHELDTIRPYRMKPGIVTDFKPGVAPKTQLRKPSSNPPLRPRSPVKVQAESKFVLPSRPALIYTEQSVDDYSDLFVDNDNVFDRRLDIMKVNFEVAYRLVV